MPSVQLKDKEVEIAAEALDALVLMDDTQTQNDAFSELKKFFRNKTKAKIFGDFILKIQSLGEPVGMATESTGQTLFSTMYEAKGKKE